MDIQKLIENYTQWLKSEITFEKIGEYYEITTPFLDNANDYLQIYVKLDNDEIIITDDGAIINGLKMNGLKLTQNRKEHLDKILFQYGVKLDGDALVSKTSLSLPLFRSLPDVFSSLQGPSTAIRGLLLPGKFQMTSRNQRFVLTYRRKR